MMGDNDRTDLKVTNSQKQEQRVQNKCVEGRRGDRQDACARASARERVRGRKIIGNNAYEIPESKR